MYPAVQRLPDSGPGLSEARLANRCCDANRYFTLR